VDASITQRIVAAAAEATNVTTTGADTPVRVTAAMVAAVAEAGRVPTASIGASATGRSGWLSSKRT
jgi:hypothetical protein